MLAKFSISAGEASHGGVQRTALSLGTAFEAIETQKEELEVIRQCRPRHACPLLWFGGARWPGLSRVAVPTRRWCNRGRACCFS